jgi:hypothetical protein
MVGVHVLHLIKNELSCLGLILFSHIFLLIFCGLVIDHFDVLAGLGVFIDLYRLIKVGELVVQFRVGILKYKGIMGVL